MGKARGGFSAAELIKSTLLQNKQNYGLQRMNETGAAVDRASSPGTNTPDPESQFKLDSRGGFMKGALGFKGLTTAELGTSGIIDMIDYHIPRIIIPNTAANNLKVIIPSLGDGQEVWIRASGTDTLTIEHTAGTGNETTGNLDLMAQDTYLGSDDDWICFHYDSSDSKFHQVTAGRQNIGGGGSSGEVFLWTANHNAGGNSLTNVDDIDFTIVSTNDASINANQAAQTFQFVTANNLHWHEEWIGGNKITVLSPTHKLYTFTSTAWNFTLNSSAGQMYNFQTGFADWNYNVIRNCAGIEYQLNSGTVANTIASDSAGNLEYRLGSSGDDHQFFVGTEFFRLDGGTNTARFYVPVDMNNNGVFFCTRVTDDGGGSSSNSIRFDGAAGVALESDTTINFTDTTGLWLASASFGVYFLRDTSPLTDDAYELGGIDILGTGFTSWHRTWVSNSMIIEDYHAAGFAPSSLSGRAQLFVRDSGAGKMQLRVKFGSTTSQLIMEET